ncbi:MAG: hypothetical protein P4L10_11015 [Acidobacteriaceae bacterium]|nr:hypothetical protein [Acidobacteriaceae bacterium]
MEIPADYDQTTWESEFHDRGTESVALPIYEGIVPLGHDHGTFYYLSRSAQQVFALTADKHSKNNMLALASLSYWEQSRFTTDKGAVKWDEAIDDLMMQCRRVGIYDTDRIRGRGAWLDNGRALLHLGNRIISNGQDVGLTMDGSKFVYESAKPLSVIHADPLSNTDAHWLIKISGLLRWEKPVYAKLFAGWIALAPICGALAWRPSIWITGGPGSGKSWLRENIMGTCLGAVALAVQSKTSEAGIRQSLGSDARPVLFDEAEREDAHAAYRMQAVLDLVRQSSSEGGAEIVKGTGNQSGAKRYRIRSTFAFQSINVALLHQADLSRISVLGLREAVNKDPLSQQRFADLEAVVAERLTPEYSAGLIARSVALIPTIRANAETFARAIAAGHGTRRLGDQIGTLLAGAYSLHSTGLITAEQAAEFVAKEEWSDHIPDDDDKDEYRLLRTLLAHRVRVGTLDMPVSRLIEAAQLYDAQEDLPHPVIAARVLSETGIKFAHRDNVPGVYVSTNHQAVRLALKGTPWDAGWGRALLRIPGATSSGHVVRFSLGNVGKATWLPMAILDPKGGE